MFSEFFQILTASRSVISYISSAAIYALLSTTEQDLKTLGATDTIENPEVDSDVRMIIFPTLVEDNQWVLYVANVPTLSSAGILDWYNSLPYHDADTNSLIGPRGIGFSGHQAR